MTSCLLSILKVSYPISTFSVMNTRWIRDEQRSSYSLLLPYILQSFFIDQTPSKEAPSIFAYEKVNNEATWISKRGWTFHYVTSCPRSALCTDKRKMFVLTYNIHVIGWFIKRFHLVFLEPSWFPRKNKSYYRKQRQRAISEQVSMIFGHSQNPQNWTFIRPYQPKKSWFKN